MIQLNDVTQSFRKNTVLNNISLYVAPQESAVIVGPSGSGKSVLLKLIAGLLDATSGTVKVSSQNIGMLFQRNALFDSLTVEENLLFPLEERLGISGKEGKKRAKEYLSAVGLQGTEHLFPDEISGGMQKRLGIARALIVEPEVILYDEPTAGLDPITSRTIADLILDLKEKSKSTLVTVTNDMQRAYQLGDRIFLLAQGDLYEGGSPEQVQQTEHPALQQFIQGLKEGPLTQEIL